MFAPGEKFTYSNTGYVALGLIIEELTGMSYEKAIQERIFDPLGMKSSGFEKTESIIPERATGYVRTLTGYATAPFMDLSQVYSAGSIYSTVEDLHLWDRALYTDKLLSDRYRAMMFKPMVVSNVGGSYGYGWVINRTALGPKQDSVTVVAHSGGLIGFGALLTRIVENEQVIILLDNRSPGATPLDRITRGIATILHDGEADPPVKSVAAYLYTTIHSGGLDAAISRYRELRKGRQREYNLSEGELNTLGYELLKEGKVDAAIEIFKLNVEAFPKAFNTYDSLAEAYMIAGNRDLALSNYAHSLVLNPSNANATIMLRKLSK
jgi:CubicO group peptidase (beta-lactamase class C family)